MKKIPRDHIGLRPIPKDADLDKLLVEMATEDHDVMEEVLNGLKKTMVQTAKEQEPPMFAYAKLLNYLASEEVKKPALIRIAAAALWELA